jgi:hypothetical protein
MLDGVALSRVWWIPSLLRLKIVFHSLFEYMSRGRLDERLNFEKGVPERCTTAMLGAVVDPAVSLCPHSDPVKGVKASERGEPD